MHTSMNDAKVKLLDTLIKHPEGLSINKLVEKLKGKVSRVVILKEVRELANLGLVSILKDVKHKQRKIVVLSSKVVSVFRETEEILERF